ncbi:MAG TPA: redoxin domain-containing protein [Capsulimonadaceae bacterium]|jgi:peroxiredoxin
MFDRSAITEGRTIQEFGLCDVKGVYQNTAKLRAKGWLAVLFFDPSDAYSASVAAQLQEWATTLPGDKLSVVGVGRGERADLVKFAADKALTYTVLWDLEDYTLGLWGVTALPTLFVTNAQGSVLAKIAGDDKPAIAAAKAVLEVGIQKAAEAAAAAKAAEEAAKAAAAAAPPPPPAPAPAAVAAPAPPADNPTPAKAETPADKGDKKSKKK